MKPRHNLYDCFMSGSVNSLFYHFFVKADAFKVNNTCIGCNQCVKKCPLNNIQLIDGKPVWGKELYTLYGLYLLLSTRGN